MVSRRSIDLQLDPVTEPKARATASFTIVAP